MQQSRLFFGIGLDLHARKQLKRWLAAHPLGGRPTHPQDLHLTLTFLGQVDAEQLASLLAQVEQLPLPPPFTLEFTRLSHWYRPGVLSLSAEQVPDALKQLTTQLAPLAEQLGRPPERRPFVPHITLMRKLHRPLRAYPDAPRLRLQVNGFALYRSLLDQPPPRYEILRHWALK